MPELGEAARRSRWIAEVPGLARAVAAWEHQLAGHRAPINVGDRRLARPGLLPPGRLVRQSVAFAAAPLDWVLTRLPEDVGTRRPLEHTGAWLEDSAGYLLRDQLANLGPVAAELGRILTDCEGVVPDFVIAELRRRPLPDPPMPSGVAAQVVRSALPGRAIDLGELVSSTPVSQLHKGVLHDGTTVLIRVVRPGVDEEVRQDARIAATVLRPFEATVPILAALRPLGIIELISRQLHQSCDLRAVALNAVEIGLVVEELDLTQVVVCRPRPGLVAAAAAVFDVPETAFPLGRAGPTLAGLDPTTSERIDSGPLARLVAESALRTGVYLADIRADQVAALPDGRMVLTACDAIGRLDLTTRRGLLDLLPALLARDPTGQMAALNDLGLVPPGAASKRRLAEELAAIQPTDSIGLLRGEGGGIAGVGRHTIAALLHAGATPPLELVQLARALLSLGTVFRRTSPPGGFLGAFAPVLGKLPELRTQMA